MITNVSRIALLGALVGLVAFVPFATTPPSSAQEAPLSRSLWTVAADIALDVPVGRLSASEQKFIESAHAHGLFAIGAGQVAFQSSSVHEVRLLAAHTLTQQAGIDEKLVALAKSKGMADMPGELDAGSRATLDTLQQASGDDDFELRYCSMVVAAYLRGIRAFQGQAVGASDPDLRQLSADVVADLKQHLAIALVIQHALASARSDAPDMITVSYPASSARTLPAA